MRLSAIGDVVRVLPAMHAIRDFFPRARLDWIVERKSANVLEGHPCLDQVIVYQRSPGIGAATLEYLDVLRTVRRGRYEIVLDFHGIFKSGVISLISGARERYGFARPRGREGSALCANRRVVLPSHDLNRVEENLLLIERLAPPPKSLNFGVYVPADVHEWIDSYFEETFGGGKLVVGMHVPVERPEKQWPLDRFAELCDMLMADGRFEVVLTFGPGQRPVAEQVMDRTRRKPKLAPETPDLQTYAWLIHRCDLYVGGDTGPMHIAAAMGTPVVAVFGKTDPRKHQPFGLPSKILGGTPNGIGGHSGLDALEPETVYDACVELVRECEANRRREAGAISKGAT